MDSDDIHQLNDAGDIMDNLQRSKAIVFSYCWGTVDCMIVEMSYPETLGAFPFGGDPEGRVWISIYRRGAAHFSPQETHPEYFAEKLNLPMANATALAELWKKMWKKSKDVAEGSVSV